MTASRLPRNPVGWILLSLGVGLGLSVSASAYGALGVLTKRGPLPADEIAVWFGGWSFVPAVFGAVVILLHLFPDGHFVSARWRWIAYVSAVIVVCATLVDAFALGRLEDISTIDNPLGATGWLGDVVTTAQHVTDPLALPGFGLAAAALIVRFRRSQGVERQQLKWISFALILVAVSLGLTAGAPGLSGNLTFFLALFALAAMPVATGFAMLRYRRPVGYCGSRGSARNVLARDIQRGPGPCVRRHRTDSPAMVAGADRAISDAARPRRRPGTGDDVHGRSRGSAWSTWGGAMMCVGAAMQAVGITFLAGAYYFATDASVSRDSAAQVFAAIADDQTHLFDTMIPGAILTLLGTVVQVVGLFRAGTVPRWIPVLLLSIVATFFVPGGGAAGLITSAPMAGSVGLGCYAWRYGAFPEACGHEVTWRRPDYVRVPAPVSTGPTGSTSRDAAG